MDGENKLRNVADRLGVNLEQLDHDFNGTQVADKINVDREMLSQTDY
jgi:hypothetical protein